MRQGSTPLFTFDVTGYDLSYATHVWVTFDQNGLQVVKKWARYPDSEDDNEGIEVIGSDTIKVKLTQEETLGFEDGFVMVQVKMKQDDLDETTTNDTVDVTVSKKLRVDKGYNKDVM